ncbi:type II toxin-antitoxin system PemK/MazF family toxin [Promicromonospora sukumoe]|uniref:type II toxin-antitoxin system PemK/MazF family toxin n=1 Tax=Promicromonospora sukumoe TaxID=88382 RepID=UPI0037C936C2
MVRVNPGDVVLLPFPLDSEAEEPYKKRPVLVVGAEGRGPDEALVVVMVTGNPHRYARPRPGDVPLSDWQSVGLARESTVRSRRFWSAESAHVVHRIGAVSDATLETVRDLIVAIVRPSTTVNQAQTNGVG